MRCGVRCVAVRLCGRVSDELHVGDDAAGEGVVREGDGAA